MRCKEIWVSPKIRVLPSENLPQSLNLAKFLLFCCGTSLVASVVNLVRPLPVYHTERPPLFTT